MTFHRQNISYLHSAWMYSGLEHRDNRGSNTHPARDRHKPNASTCDSQQWAVVTENSVRAENAVVPSIREILVVSR